MRFRLFIVALFLHCSSYAQNKIVIAAASDLKFALDSVVNAFRQNHTGEIQVIYGSSGKLTEQILQGAPFDIFFSADTSYPEQLQKEKKTASEIYPYAKGRIVLWSSKIDPQVMKMKSLQNSSVTKISIANPAHAPYGKRAIESLTFYNLLNAVQPKLVYGENISQAAQFVTSGAADIGIIALSLALSPNMKQGKYYLIPEESHTPLIQGAVITLHGKGNTLAESFFTFLHDKKAVAILKEQGLAKP